MKKALFYGYANAIVETRRLLLREVLNMVTKKVAVACEKKNARRISENG
jgi:hypothetical protein